MIKHPHLKLVVSKPVGWQKAPVQKPIFTHFHLYFAYVGVALSVALTLSLLLGIYHALRMTP